jgi:hypothetical protein
MSYVTRGRDKRIAIASSALKILSTDNGIKIFFLSSSHLLDLDQNVNEFISETYIIKRFVTAQLEIMTIHTHLERENKYHCHCIVCKEK